VRDCSDNALVRGFFRNTPNSPFTLERVKEIVVLLEEIFILCGVSLWRESYPMARDAKLRLFGGSSTYFFLSGTAPELVETYDLSCNRVVWNSGKSASFDSDCMD
jgi:hypothetical protein